ncbi:hypothetical protein PG291_10190 [Riemerella anatipestifer]|nr:hypothetical protein [Riemerella anatipestifer]
MEKYNTLKNKKDYENFILEIPTEIKNLSHLVGKSELDFSEEEVREISKIFIELNVDGLFDNRLKRMLMVYVGEFFRYHFGGEWDFTGLKSDSWAINEPVITKYKDEGMRMSPSEWIWGLFEKNNPNSFNESIIYMIEFQKKTEEVFAKIFPKKKKK